MKTKYYVEQKTLDWKKIVHEVSIKMGVLFSVYFTVSISILDVTNKVIVFPDVYFPPTILMIFFTIFYMLDTRHNYIKTTRIPVQKEDCKKGGEEE